MGREGGRPGRAFRPTPRASAASGDRDLRRPALPRSRLPGDPGRGRDVFGREERPCCRRTRAAGWVAGRGHRCRRARRRPAARAAVGASASSGAVAADARRQLPSAIDAALAERPIRCVLTAAEPWRPETVVGRRLHRRRRGRVAELRGVEMYAGPSMPSAPSALPPIAIVGRALRPARRAHAGGRSGRPCCDGRDAAVRASRPGAGASTRDACCPLRARTRRRRSLVVGPRRLREGFETRLRPAAASACPPEEVAPPRPALPWAAARRARGAARRRLRTSGAPSPRAGAVVGNLSLPSAASARLVERRWISAASAWWPERRRPASRPDPRNRFMSGLPGASAGRARSGSTAGAFALDAACASSLYAIKLACDWLHDRARRPHAGRRRQPRRRPLPPRRLLRARGPEPQRPQPAVPSRRRRPGPGRGRGLRGAEAARRRASPRATASSA